MHTDGSNVQTSSNSHTGGGAWELLKGTVTNATNITNMNLYCGIQAAGTGNIAGVASGDYFEIAFLQTELGSVATNFEHRSFGEELALCQRYYWTVQTGSDGGYGQKAGAVIIHSFNSTGTFPVKMRAAPTTTFTTGTQQNCNSYTINTNQNSYITRVYPGTTGSYRAYEQDITFSAEL